MKRTIVFLFTCSLLVLLLIACGGTETPAAPPAQPEQPAAADTTADSPATAVTEPESEEAEPEPEPEPAAEEQAALRVLRVAATANVTTWDPIRSFSTEAMYMANIYEQLLRINPPGAAEPFTPLLAESWEVSDDGLVWTFNLRPNVTFHDGEPLTAAAVKMSLEAAAARGGASFIWFPLDEVEVVDDLTVRIHLNYAASVDLIASSLYGAWIVSPRALAAAEDDPDYFEAGIAAGTGPYMLESYSPDQEVLLTRFDDYWGGWQDHQADKVLILIVPEAVQQQQMLEGNQVDLALSLPRENYASLGNQPGYELVVESSYFNYVGFFNTLRPPLDDPLVRQALSYAIPYEDIIAVGTLGYATQSRGPVPAGVWPYSENVMQYTYDPDRARDLLEEAGYPDGGFSLRLTYAAENQTHERYAPLLKDAFEDLGVSVTIEPILFNQQWEEAKSDPENAQDIFLLLYWPTYSDAGTDNLWSMFYGNQAPFFNLSYWTNDQFDEMIDEAAVLTVTDPPQAQQLYEDAMNLLVEEAPGFFLFDTQAVYVIPDHVQGFEYNLHYPFATFFYDIYTER
jgi:peptide/nickel transport system substrate-binding protein